ncbi:MAG: DUF4445 domain-containing protein [Ruminococcaceae bacterium]|nr:DUF4445 domain-containing protein [Oscillospiraceae bacterium]
MKEKIKITTADKVLFAQRGTLLADALRIEKICGGNGKCGKCKVKVNGKEELACKYLLTDDVFVETDERGEVFSESGAFESGRITDNLCYALDIGTTTLALALVSLDTKEIVKVVTATNPQCVFGADVITRVDYCAKNSVKDLHEALIAEINRMIEKIGNHCPDTMYVSANVTMLHTFFGVDCSSIGVAPYTPAFLDSKRMAASVLNIKGVLEIVSLPSVASFVGADIVAGVNYIGEPLGDSYKLLVDLGTNAEIVLFSKEGGIATAAAAGPCFEGANIKNGMSATDGAIYSFSIDNGSASYKTVNNTEAKGICGTGLVDAVAALLKNGFIDGGGFMEDAYALSEGIALTPEDVRQYQLAKSAVYSAIISLMKKQGVAFEDISGMYISGGFSAKINIDNAIFTGLLPKELREKTVAVNNSSLLGTVKYACGDGDVSVIRDKIRYVDLSTDSYFSELFVENMIFGDN